MRRLFFAIPLPDKRKNEIIHLFPQKKFHGIRWVDEKNMHLTVLFLGATPDEQLDVILEKSQAICKMISAFELKFDSFKTIFKDKKPVMIWMQFEENKAFEKLCELFRKSFPTEEKRKPLPHLTLARIRQLHQLPFDLPKSKSFSFVADKIELWESKLNTEGAEYFCLHTFPFQGVRQIFP